MSTASSGAGATYDLSELIFSAKIDYFTIYTPSGYRPLPPLNGIAKWARRHNNDRLSIHDPSPADVGRLRELFEDPALLELEVAVDVRPRASMDVTARKDLLEAVIVGMMAKRLAPSVVHEDLAFRFRGAFEGTREKFRLRPFNRVLPSPDAQQLHGKRSDPVQVKVYLKTVDQGKVLQARSHVVRVEVRLSGDGLRLHGLATTADLLDFSYRKELRPYFRHVSAARRAASGPPGDAGMLRVLRAKQDDIRQEEWDRMGVGSILPGGRHSEAKVRLLRDTPINNRIGQALMRLERRMNSCAQSVLPEENSQR